MTIADLTDLPRLRALPNCLTSLTVMLTHHLASDYKARADGNWEINQPRGTPQTVCLGEPENPNHEKLGRPVTGLTGSVLPNTHVSRSTFAHLRCLCTPSKSTPALPVGLASALSTSHSTHFTFTHFTSSRHRSPGTEPGTHGRSRGKRISNFAPQSGPQPHPNPPSRHLHIIFIPFIPQRRGDGQVPLRPEHESSVNAGGRAWRVHSPSSRTSTSYFSR